MYIVIMTFFHVYCCCCSGSTSRGRCPDGIVLMNNLYQSPFCLLLEEKRRQDKRKEEREEKREQNRIELLLSSFQQSNPRQKSLWVLVHPGSLELQQ